MTIPFGHHVIANRYNFEGDLQLMTPLCVSSGKASYETDAPFIRTVSGVPYIPGSSLRGAIRSEVERIIATVGPAAGITGCVMFTSGSCDDKYRAAFNGIEKTDEDIMRFAETELCDICKLFGSPVYAARLVIEDALPSPQGDLRSHARIRDGIGIDRDTGAARDGVKFDYEVIESGPKFFFKMTVENVSDNVSGADRKVINLIRALLKDGLHVGGKRAGGMGKIRLSNENITGFSDPKTMWDNLMKNENVSKPIAWQEASNA